MKNKVVVRYLDGRTAKGFTTDFLPTRDKFHVSPNESPGQPVPVRLADVKAVFFVKDFTGNKDYQDRLEFDQSSKGRKLRVTFHDSEVIVGTTQGYDPSRPGFFLNPADPKSNIERCFVVASSAAQVSVI